MVICIKEEHTFSGHIGKYDGIVGQYYYIINDNNEEWYYGILRKAWEKEGYGFLSLGTKRFHKLEIKKQANCIRYAAWSS